MFYNSTRNSGIKVSSAEAITLGISAEGGLFVPESIPLITLEEVRKLGDMSYADRAAYVFGKYLTDFTDAEIHYCTDNAYSTKNFESESIAEISHLFDGTYMLERSFRRNGRKSRNAQRRRRFPLKAYAVRRRQILRNG